MSAVAALQETAQTVVRQENTPVSGKPIYAPNPPTDRDEEIKQTERKEQHPINEEWLTERTNLMNQVMNIFNRDIQFSVDDQSNQLIVKVVDSKTGDVIRQIPPDVMLHLMRSIDKNLGLILDEIV